MGRRARNWAEPTCYHITHRCHERRFFLKFKTDRRRYMTRLRQMSLAHPVDVLDFVITSNHVHLLLWAKHASQLSEAMRFLQGTAAGDYNRRKAREGSFWRGRYHPTLVETGRHLSRCMFYIDLNLVRAGACRHPREWFGAGYDELCGGRQRYRIINTRRLLWCLGIGDEAQFRQWYVATIDDEVSRGYRVREPFWSTALAVGGEQWVRSRVPAVRTVRIERVPDCPQGSSGAVAESAALYAAHGPKREREALWQTEQERPLR